MSESDPIDVGALGLVLLHAIRDALPAWAERVVVERGGPSLASAGHASGVAAWAGLVGALTDLLTADIDAQRGTPLSLLRGAITWPTAVLAEAGASPVQRDPFDEDRFPDDVYGLNPAAFSDFGEDVGDAGLRWSVAKAFEHKRRHQG